MPTKFLTPDEAREHLQRVDRQNAELRAKAPPGCADLYARLFPPVSAEIFRHVMEMALLGQCPDPRELPPLNNSGDDERERSPDDQHEQNAQSA